MTTSELYRELALLNDEEAKRCLEGVLATFAPKNPKLRKFYATEKAVANSIAQAAQLAMLGDKVPHLSEKAVKNQATAIRAILVEMASDKHRKKDLDNCLTKKRNTLFDPITAALVLAGIVFVLELDIEVEIKNGKVSGRVKKAPTNKTLLEKFFSLFK